MFGAARGTEEGGGVTGVVPDPNVWEDIVEVGGAGTDIAIPCEGVNKTVAFGESGLGRWSVHSECM